MASGRKPTAAMPKPVSYGYGCPRCPPTADGAMRIIGGYLTEDAAMKGLQRHNLVEHVGIVAAGQTSWIKCCSTGACRCTR